MDATNRLRQDVICNIAKLMPQKGKTAMMKTMFFLQEVYKVPLNYDFTIFTFGPFDEDVLMYMDYAKHKELIDIKPDPSVDYLSYNITHIEEPEKLDRQHDESLKEIVKNFGSFTVKEWELASTILFSYLSLYESNPGAEMNMDELDEDVRRIKPHFSRDKIKEKREFLDGLGIFDKAIAD